MIRLVIAACLGVPIAAWTWRLGSQARKRISLDAARALAPKHPVWRNPPGIPRDGEPLSDDDQRAFKSITAGVKA